MADYFTSLWVQSITMWVSSFLSIGMLTSAPVVTLAAQDPSDQTEDVCARSDWTWGTNHPFCANAYNWFGTYNEETGPVPPPQPRPNPDTTPPQIFAPTTKTLTSTSVELLWLTDELATGRVYVSRTPSVDKGSVDTWAITSTKSFDAHSLTIEDLEPGTTYYYIIESVDASGNVGSVTEHSFTTQTE